MLIMIYQSKMKQMDNKRALSETGCYLLANNSSFVNLSIIISPNRKTDMYFNAERRNAKRSGVCRCRKLQ